MAAEHPTWDKERFLDYVRRGEKRSSLVLVAKHNRELVIAGVVPIPLTYSLTCASIAATPIMTPSHGVGANVLLWSETTDEAVWRCHRDSDRYDRIDVLSFGNCRGPGGGYKHGDITQEEQLHRVAPALFASLSRSTYSFAFNREIKYTTGVHVLREASQEYILTSIELSPRIGVITAAAPDLRLAPFAGDRWREEEVRAVIDSVYRTPLVCENHSRLPSTIIVGAFGCGAFANDPREMATMFAQITKQYRCYYRNIIFAIPDASSVNHVTFRHALSEANLLSL